MGNQRQIPGLIEKSGDGVNITEPAQKFASARGVDPDKYIPTVTTISTERRKAISEVEHCGKWNTYWASKNSLGHVMANRERNNEGKYTGNNLENQFGYAYAFVTEDMVVDSVDDLGTHDFFVHGPWRAEANGRIVNWEGLYLLAEPKQAKIHRDSLLHQRRMQQQEASITSEILKDLDPNVKKNQQALQEVQAGTYFREEQVAV